MILTPEPLRPSSWTLRHGDEVLAIGFVDFVDRADVGMIERGGGKSLSLEAFARGGVVPISAGRNFNATWRRSLRSSAS
jgi:hypothetical protein